MIIKKIKADDFQMLSKNGRALLKRAYTIKDKNNPNKHFNFVYDDGESAIYATNCHIAIRINESTGQRMLFNSNFARLDEEFLNQYPKKKIDEIFTYKKNRKTHRLFIFFIEKLKSLLPFYDIIEFSNKKVTLYPNYYKMGIFALPPLNVTPYINMFNVKEKFKLDFSLFCKATDKVINIIEVNIMYNNTPPQLTFTNKGADYVICLKNDYYIDNNTKPIYLNRSEIVEYASLIKFMIKFCNERGGEITKKGDYVIYNNKTQKVEIKSPLFSLFNENRLREIFTIKKGA